ncbi:YqaA family protein [Peristeroidobacter soli]|uniref:YqaA family protein n=1 Tax=Peristeroidobacter soli TaxID=2497877 RepID=UPI00101DD381
MPDLAIYAGLFLVAFLAATFLPMQSEAALVGLLLTDNYPASLLVTVASVGNVLGATLNWGLGRWVERFSERSWFPVQPATLERYRAWYQRYGKWSLLLSWVPLIGDPLTVIAGVLREPLPVFLLLVTVAKVGRYLVLTAVTLHWA